MHIRESNPSPIPILVEHLNHWATKPFYANEFINLNTHWRSPDLLSPSFKISSESNLSLSLPCHTQQPQQPPLWPPPSPSPLQPTPPPLRQQRSKEKGDNDDDDQGLRHRCVSAHVCFFYSFFIYSTNNYLQVWRVQQQQHWHYHHHLHHLHHFDRNEDDQHLHLSFMYIFLILFNLFY